MAKRRTSNKIENGYKLELEGRVSGLEQNYYNMSGKIDTLTTSFDTFKNNHFEHFKDDIFAKIGAVKPGVPPAMAFIMSMLSVLVTGLIMWIATH